MNHMLKSSSHLTSNNLTMKSFLLRIDIKIT